MEPDGLLDEIFDRQEKLNQYLKELANISLLEQDEERDKRIASIGDKLAELYRTPLQSDSSYGYRHLYSSFLPDVMNDLTDEQLDCLVSYLKKILRNYQNEPTIFHRLLKLYDHIALDISRSQYIKKNEDLNNIIDKTSAKIENVGNNTESLKIALKETEDKVSDLEKTSDKYTIQIISVLGIFSAIIIVFTGGLSYISESLGALGTIPSREVAALALLCGAIMYDLIVLLLYFIGVVINSKFLTSLKEKIIVVVIPNTVITLCIIGIICSMILIA